MSTSKPDEWIKKGKTCSKVPPIGDSVLRCYSTDSEILRFWQPNTSFFKYKIYDLHWALLRVTIFAYLHIMDPRYALCEDTVEIVQYGSGK